MTLVPSPAESASRAPAATQAPASSLPDINSETYPFEVVQRLLDEAAYFNLFSVPQPEAGCGLPHPTTSGNVVGFRIAENLRRFRVSLQPPSGSGDLRATDDTGDIVARFEHRWMLIPDGFAALPGQEPPPVCLDESRSQRFVMLDGRCVFGQGEDGFAGFGTGTTYPTVVNGQRQLLAAAVGNIMEGFGRFKGHDGTYVYCGSLSAQGGFTGSLLLRAMDHEGTLRTDSSFPGIEKIARPEPGITYIVFRGQKRDRNQKTEYIMGPGGDITGLNVAQQLRAMDVDCGWGGGRHDVRASAQVGPVIGSMRAQITFNLLNPGAPGTRVSPIPFKSYNTYTFFDRREREIGTIEANGGEGRTFNLTLAGAPGQRALRFGGFGPIVKGTGYFRGIEGLMTDNSVVGIAPHALATFYVLRIHDPEGRFRVR
ncbi:MAG TPA: hypothetical protein VNZ47_12300 [Candidatus Dormibacteraeota bacterium]|nr:hypothetical protein [Candidatus Dormibacteraeota bacterium]